MDKATAKDLLRAAVNLGVETVVHEGTLWNRVDLMKAMIEGDRK